MRYCQIVDEFDTKYTIEVNVPTNCPHCNVACHFEEVYGYEKNARSAVLMICPRCGHYIVVETSSYKSKTYPTPKFQFDLSSELSNLSSRFVNIYCQSMQAKLNGQDELVGMGLRKALEFLIFDYLKSQNIDFNEHTTLSQAINKLDKSFKTTAQVASWIGNDNTHYFIKNQNLDIDCLVKYVKTIAYHISANLIDKEASEIASSMSKS